MKLFVNKEQISFLSRKTNLGWYYSRNIQKLKIVTNNNINKLIRKRHFSRMRTTGLPTVHALVSPPDVRTVGVLK